MSHRWLKFWPQDWQRDPALRSCSLAARGLWIEMLCLMHDGDPYGHLTINSKPMTARQLASYAGRPEREVSDIIGQLDEAGVFSKTDEGVIYSRRMVRDKATSDKGKQDGKNGGNPALKGTKLRVVNGGGNPGGLTPSVKAKDHDPLSSKNTEAEAEERIPPIAPLSPRSRRHSVGAADSDFETFWAAYPRKVGKDAARKAWAKAVKRADPASIGVGLARQNWPTDSQFIPHPATWLNQGRWQDDPAAAAPSAKPTRAQEQNLRMAALRLPDEHDQSHLLRLQ